MASDSDDRNLSPSVEVCSVRGVDLVAGQTLKSKRDVDSCNDSDCSLESVDLTTLDVVDDECIWSKDSIEEQPQPNQGLQRQKCDKILPTTTTTDLNSPLHECGSGDCATRDPSTKECETSADISGLYPAYQSSIPFKIQTPASLITDARRRAVLAPLLTRDNCTVFLEHENKCRAYVSPDEGNETNNNGGRRTSVFDDLLFDIYDRWHSGWRDSFDSDTFTDLTESDAVFGRSYWNPSEIDTDKKHLNVKMLKTKDVFELEQMISDIFHRISQMSSHLIRQLKCRERRLASLREKCDIITAILHASSLKRRIDSKIRFSLEPLPGDDAFSQWKDAMKAVARLPMGIPPEFRKKVWLALADDYLSGLCVDWEKTKRLAFNEKSNPDDSKLGLQIVKDLHRTGCSGFNGRDNEEDRAVLKRVLLAYARWNKLVGYCQGFNILAALILDVVDRKEDCALKVMIFLVDRVLPESYFANNLRALSVDMAVFRDLLRSRLSQLSKHLDHLQNAARDQTTGANYEPPLTNVFTMQWFLTLFATCLPKSIALRVWDSVFLEGSEILLRTAIAIWGTLESRILSIHSADEFYTSMGVLSQEMLDGKIVDADKLMKAIYTMAPFPFPQLTELREKYTYNITPFTAALNSGRNPQKLAVQGNASIVFADDEDLDEEEMMENMNCFAGLFLPQNSSPSKAVSSDVESSSDVSKASPGAYAATPVEIGVNMPAYSDRITLDIDMLHKQYKRLKQRQKQAHIILAAAGARQKRSQPLTTTSSQDLRVLPEATDSPTAVNHLFVSRQMMKNRNKNAAVSPALSGSSLDSSHLTPQQLSKSTRNGQKQSNSFVLSWDMHHPSSHLILADSSASSFSEISRSDSPCTASDITFTGDSSSSSSICSDKGSYKSSSCEDAVNQISRSNSVNANVTSGKSAEREEVSGGRELCETSAKSQETEHVAGSALDVVQHRDEEASIPGHGIYDKNTTPASDPRADDRRVRSAKTQNAKMRGSSSEIDDSSSAELTFHEPARKSSSEGPHQNQAKANAAQEKASALKSPTALEEKSFTKKPNVVDPREADSNVETVVKVFNPFPKHYMHPRKNRNSIRLGLYPEEHITHMDSGTVGVGQIKRSADQVHRTAYLQRQYIMEMVKQSKANKS